jgi:protoheme IX farnesyltransferase
VTGNVSFAPLVLFAIIFVWTPPHFWALSIKYRDDYARARVPMLPVTNGAKSTRRHVFVYSLLLAPIGLAPMLTGLGGPIYGAIAGLGGALFLFLAFRVLRSRAGEGDKAQDKPARDLFGFSILYLFALFAALLAERGFG